MMFYDEFQSPLGLIQVQADGVGLTALAFQNGSAAISANNCQHAPEKFVEVKSQLAEYFAGHRHKFTLPLSMQGTRFQQQVWQALLTIPYGKTCSYRDIACQLNNDKAVRAVGGANGKNPIAIIVPCHRVIGANKSLTGYAGGLSFKQALLTLEQSFFEQ